MSRLITYVAALIFAAPVVDHFLPGQPPYVFGWLCGAVALVECALVAIVIPDSKP